MRVKKLLEILEAAVKQDPEMEVAIDDDGYITGLRDDIYTSDGQYMDVGVIPFRFKGEDKDRPIFLIQAGGEYFGGLLVKTGV